MKTISMKWEEDLLARIDADAKASGVTRSDWLRKAALDLLMTQGDSPLEPPAGETLKATPKPPKAKRPPKTPQPQVTPEPPKAPSSTHCSHPKASLNRFSWGTICGECNARVS